MNVSDAIKNAYKNSSHSKILSISFPDLDYIVPEDEVYYESMTLDEAIFDSDSFEVIGCIASHFEIQIRDTGENLKGEHIIVSISLSDVEDSEIPLFDGYVDSVDREAQKKMQKITAYDALYSKGGTDVAEWYNNLDFPITLSDFRDSLFEYIDIEQEEVELPNDSILVQKEYAPNTLKAINVIKAICQINGCFGIINRTGIFTYRFLDVEQTPENVSFYRSMDYKDYYVNPIDRLTIRQTTDDSGITIGTGENEYIIQGNMFTYNLEPTAIYRIATNIYPYLRDIEYIPFEASNNGYPWVEVGDDCVLNYQVYDFDNSTSSQDVYKSVNVVVMKRSMKGIQNLIDTYSAEGQELQREFISDTSVDLDILQQTVDNIVKNMSTEITTYRNTATINISDGNTVDIADMVYQASEGNTVLFHEEASIEVEATESNANVYTENDVLATVRYYVNGYRMPNHISEGLLREGKHILNLMQFWEAGDRDTNRVQAKLTVEGGSVRIQRFRAQAYITVKQSDYNNAGIEVTTQPDKIVYELGDTLDFTGLVVSKVYYDDTIPFENITSQCVFRPVEGTTVTSTDLIEVLVTYTETTEIGEIKTYETSFYLSTNYLISISVEEEPAKSEYAVGENLDLTGIKVVADYADGTTKDVTSSCIFNPANGYTFTSINEGEIAITYTENGITVTTSTVVSVQEILLTDIEVTTEPTNTSYWLGDETDYTGIVVSAIYSDDTSKDVTASCTFSPANGTATTSIEQSEVIVSYVEKGKTYTTSFAIEVKEPEPFLKYVIYTIDTTNRTIYVSGLNVAEIAEDDLRNLTIPSTYIDPESGITFNVLLTGD